MEFQYEPGRIYATDGGGALVAEITFPTLADGRTVIDHTFVDGTLRGQGVAGRLVEAAAARLRAEGRRAAVTCSYAQKWFAQHPEQADVLGPV